MFMTHPTFRVPQSAAMPLAPVKVFGTIGTVNQGVQKDLAVLRLALLAGSIQDGMVKRLFLPGHLCWKIYLTGST